MSDRLMLACSVAAAAFVVELCGGTYAAAQPTSGPPVGPMAATQANAASKTPAPEEIVVTAQRRSTKLARTPVAVSVLSSRALRQQAIVTQQDLQSAVPGLVVRGTADSNQLNYAIRGQTVDAFTSSPPAVLPYVDEVAAVTGGSTAFYDLDSVQVLKGPQGTLFGRNGTGGALLFTTSPPRDEFGGYLMSRVGDYGLGQVEGALNVPVVADRLLVRVSGFYETREGFQQNLYTGERVGDLDRQGGRLSVTLKPTDELRNDLVVDYLNTGGSSTVPVLYSVYPPFGGPNLIPATLLYSPLLNDVLGPGAWQAYLAAHPGVDPLGIGDALLRQQTRGPFVVDTNQAQLHHSDDILVSDKTSYDLGGDTQLKNIFGFVHSDAKDGEDIDATAYTIEQTGGVNRTNTEQFSEELQLLDKVLDQQLSYVAGFYYLNNRTDNATPAVFLDLTPLIAPTTVLYNTRATDTSYAGYVQGDLDLSRMTGIEGLGVTAGLRYTDETVRLEELPGSAFYGLPAPFLGTQSTDVGKLSWQVGIKEQLSPDLLVYVTSRHSFRTGGFNADAAPLAGTASVGGAAFLPETATDIEGGIKFRGDLGSVPVSANLAVYNEWVDNVQRSIYAFNGTSPTGYTINVPRAQVTGVELDGAINPLSWLRIGGSFAYTDARFTDAAATLFGSAVTYGPYPDAPRWSADGYAQASQAIGDRYAIFARADIYAQTSTYFSSLNNTLNPGTALPSYSLTNFRVEFDDTVRHWSLAGGVKNAFDRVYYVGGLPTGHLLGFNSALPGEPRTFYVEARIGF